MLTYPLVAIVTLLALLVYFYMGLRVGQGRGKYGVVPPAVVGHPNFERDYRIQMNTLEWLPLFLVSLWLFAAFVPFTATALIAAWRLTSSRFVDAV